MGLTITCVTLGIRARRATVPATEEFGYGRALGAGVMIGLFAGVFGMVTMSIYTKFINPDFSEFLVQAQLQKLETQGNSAAQLEGAEKIMRMFSGPVAQAVSALFGNLVLGTLVSLVAAAFLKRPAANEILSTPPPIG